MSEILDSAQVLSRLALRGTISTSAGSADASKFVRTNADGVLDDTLLETTATLTSHIADNTKHLTSGQNSLLDAVTATAVEINYLTGVTSSVQTQLDAKLTGAALSSHASDATLHLTGGQNTLLDALTATAAELNYSVGVTSAIQTQLTTDASNLTTHIADATKHLTSGQNSLLDAITASATEINYLVGVTSGIQAQFAALSATALTSGTVPDARFPSTLPALSGVNLTALNASNLASGTVALARLPLSTITLDTIGNGTDITTNDVSSAKHGLCPKLSNDTKTYLGGDGTWRRPNTYADIITSSPGSAVSPFTINAVDTSSGSVSISLPSTPTAGMTVDFIDTKGSFATHNLTIVPTGSKNIAGSPSSYISSTNSVKLKAVYIDDTYGWSIK